MTGSVATCSGLYADGLLPVASRSLPTGKWLAYLWCIQVGPDHVNLRSHPFGPYLAFERTYLSRLCLVNVWHDMFRSHIVGAGLFASRLCDVAP